MTNPERGDQGRPVRPAIDTPDAPGAQPGAITRPQPVKPVPRSRLGGVWIALTSGAVVLLLLLIFILENGREVEIAYFGAHGSLPLGVALLLAAIFGILLVVIPGAGRIVQLRMTARRNARRARAQQAPQPEQQNRPVPPGMPEA